MKIDIKNKPKKKEDYKLKRIIRKGTVGAFIAGWMVSEILNKIDQIRKGEDPLKPELPKPPEASQGIDKDLITNTDSVEDYTYSILPASGNSIYGNYQGVDISNLNGEVNVPALKENGVDFVIIRAFDCIDMDYEGDYLQELDRSWLEKIRDCQANNIPFGIYIYSRATTEEMAEQEAVKLIKFLSRENIRPDFPIYWDIEANEYEPLKRPDNEFVDSREFIYGNPEQTLKNFKAFARVMEKYGYYTGIYTSDSILCAIDPDGTKLKDYAIWDAAWRYGEGGSRMDFEYDFNPIEPSYKGDIGIYQFSCTGRFPENDHTFDCDLCKYNYAGIVHAKGLNKPVDYDTYFGSDPSYKEIVDGEYPKSKKR